MPAHGCLYNYAVQRRLTTLSGVQVHSIAVQQARPQQREQWLEDLASTLEEDVSRHCSCWCCCLWFVSCLCIQVSSSCCLLMQVQRDSRHVGKFSPHQLEILTEASAQGRRRVKIQKIAQELALPREEVLQFIKDFASRPENR